jgi:hypothetical protein
MRRVHVPADAMFGVSKPSSLRGCPARGFHALARCFRHACVCLMFRPEPRLYRGDLIVSEAAMPTLPLISQPANTVQQSCV